MIVIDFENHTVKGKVKKISGWKCLLVLTLFIEKWKQRYMLSGSRAKMERQN